MRARSLRVSTCGSLREKSAIDGQVSTVAVCGPMDRLRGKTALVTGAASGIGKATAILFASEGARVVATDLDPSGEEVAAAIVRRGGEAIFLRHDVSDEASWAGALRRVPEAFGPLDVLVNNAGISFAKPLEETTLAEGRGGKAGHPPGGFPPRP